MRQRPSTTPARSSPNWLLLRFCSRQEVEESTERLAWHWQQHFEDNDRQWRPTRRERLEDEDSEACMHIMTRSHEVLLVWQAHKKTASNLVPLWPSPNCGKNDKSGCAPHASISNSLSVSTFLYCFSVFVSFTLSQPPALSLSLSLSISQLLSLFFLRVSLSLSLSPSRSVSPTLFFNLSWGPPISRAHSLSFFLYMSQSQSQSVSLSLSITLSFSSLYSIHFFIPLCLSFWFSKLVLQTLVTPNQETKHRPNKFMFMCLFSFLITGRQHTVSCLDCISADLSEKPRVQLGYRWRVLPRVPSHKLLEIYFLWMLAEKGRLIRLPD